MFDNDLENYVTALTRYHATMNIIFLVTFKLNFFVFHPVIVGKGRVGSITHY